MTKQLLMMGVLFFLLVGCGQRSMVMFGVKGSVQDEAPAIKGLAAIVHFTGSNLDYDKFKENILVNGILVEDRLEIGSLLEMINIKGSKAGQTNEDLTKDRIFIILDNTVAILTKEPQRFVCSFYPVPVV